MLQFGLRIRILRVIKFMKITFWMTVFSLATATSLLADDAKILGDTQSRSSYAIGMMMGERWKQQGIDLNNEVFLRGLEDAETGTNTLMTEKEMGDTLQQFQLTLMAKQKQMRAEMGEKNKAEGSAFLAANKNNPGVVTLPDGLQYKVLTDGTGKMPSSDDVVTVNYRGTFVDGKEFDSSAKAGHPAQFQANHVIPGWTEALTKMKVGSKWELFIPPVLAYGEQGGRSIPPDATLIFEVELLDVKAALPVAPPAPLTTCDSAALLEPAFPLSPP